jgi:hypothetical protein
MAGRHAWEQRVQSPDGRRGRVGGRGQLARGCMQLTKTHARDTSPEPAGRSQMSRTRLLRARIARYLPTYGQSTGSLLRPRSRGSPAAPCWARHQRTESHSRFLRGPSHTTAPTLASSSTCPHHGQSVGSQSVAGTHVSHWQYRGIARRSPTSTFQQEQLTSDQILVQLVHLRHVVALDLEAANLCVLGDARLPDALGQRHIAVLQAPPYQQLAGRARILLGEGHNRGVLHAQRPDQRRVGLDDDAVLLAKGSDVFARVERVHLDLVDRRRNPRLRVQKLLELLHCQSKCL